MSVCKSTVLYVVTVIVVHRSYWGSAEKHGVDSLCTFFAFVHVCIVQSMQDLYWQRQRHICKHFSLGTPVFLFPLAVFLPKVTILPYFSQLMPNSPTTGFWHRTVQSTVLLPHSEMGGTFPIWYAKNSTKIGTCILLNLSSWYFCRSRRPHQHNHWAADKTRQ